MAPDAPNYTQVPNSLLGDILPGNEVDPGLMARLEGSELKVYLAVCRMTIGYHQETRRASFSMVETFTGLSRPAVNKAAKSLESMGLIERLKDGGVTLWKLAVNSVNQDELVNSVNQQGDYGQPAVNSVNRPVNSVNQTSKLSLPPSKKETKKETLKRKTTTVAATVFEIYENEIGALSPITRDKLVDDCEEYSEDWVVKAIGIAAQSNKRNLRYVGGILKRWKAQGGPQHDGPRNGATNGQHQKSDEAATSAQRDRLIAEIKALGGVPDLRYSGP